MRLHGLVKAEDGSDDKMKVRSCQRCKEYNSPIAKFCIRCGLPLEQNFSVKVEKERLNSDGIMNKLMEDKEYFEFAMKKIIEKGLDKSIG